MNGLLNIIDVYPRRRYFVFHIIVPKILQALYHALDVESWTERLDGVSLLSLVVSFTIFLVSGSGPKMCLVGEASLLWRMQRFMMLYIVHFLLMIVTNILQAFCEAWCPLTNTLLTSVGEISIPLWDLYAIGGLPITGSIYEKVMPNVAKLTGTCDKRGKDFSLRLLSICLQPSILYEKELAVTRMFLWASV